MAGVEPAAPRSQTECADQTALHPDIQLSSYGGNVEMDAGAGFEPAMMPYEGSVLDRARRPRVMKKEVRR